MGRVVRFSEFDEYLFNLKQNGTKVEGTILDANVIITLSYSPKKFHTRTYEFIKNKIQKNEIALYTTVNTTQEYLEFYRRLLLTEGLRTAIHPSSELDLPNKKKQAIRAQSSILQNREMHQGAEPIFNDREIKKIREVFLNSGIIKNSNIQTIATTTAILDSSERGLIHFSIFKGLLVFLDCFNRFIKKSSICLIITFSIN